MTQLVTSKRVIDWEPIRKTFVESPDRPTYAELGAEFSIPLSTICNAAAEEGWSLLRAQRLERALQSSEAAGTLLAVAKSETVLTSRLREFAAVVLQVLTVELAKLPDKQGPKLNAVQTATFAILNVCNSLKAAGVFGLPKELRERLAGEPGGDNWKGALRDLNVMLKVDVGGSAPAKVTDIIATPKV